jgi:hypothetical protein
MPLFLRLSRPQPINVHAGSADETLKAKIGKEGARTIPGRPEHGGKSLLLRGDGESMLMI